MTLVCFFRQRCLYEGSNVLSRVGDLERLGAYWSVSDEYAPSWHKRRPIFATQARLVVVGLTAA